MGNMAKHIVGTSRENCPVVAFLKGVELAENKMSLWDEVRAEHVAAIPGAAEEVMAQCPDGGPHEILSSWLLTRMLTGGDVLCGSEALDVPHEPMVYDGITQSSLDRAIVQLNTLL
jgi:hypothetical protein